MDEAYTEHRELSTHPKETGLWYKLRPYIVGGPVGHPIEIQNAIFGLSTRGHIFDSYFGDMDQHQITYSSKSTETLRFDRWTGYWDVFQFEIYENDLVVVRGFEEVGLVKWGWALGCWTVVGDSGTSLLVPWPQMEEGYRCAIVGKIHLDSHLFDADYHYEIPRNVIEALQEPPAKG